MSRLVRGGRGLLRPVTGMAMLCLMLAGFAAAEEGMWTFDNPPLQAIQEKYGVTLSREWLDHLRMASVRFNDGGSGSFVSPTGLVLTNHHVAMGQLQKLSSAEKDYASLGFYAATPAEEIPCPDLELNVLVSLENVTDAVLTAVKPGMTSQQALEARQAECARLEKDSLARTGLRSDVVSLYQGGEYWLYRYKKYTEVKLVFAPDNAAAFFGGDLDNFTFPRHDLDMALFRVYENGQPVKPDHYLKWNTAGAPDGAPVFVSGHPGRTNRLMTVAQLEYQRDHVYPSRLELINRMREVLGRYAARGREQRRQAGGMIKGLENSFKAMTGEYQGLLDKTLMEQKRRDEEAFRRKVEENPEWQKEFGNAWAVLAGSCLKARERLALSQAFKERGPRLPAMALSIVQYVTEVKKPDGERLEGYHDSQLASLKFRLLSPAPIYPEMEEFFLAELLAYRLEKLGPGHSYLQAMLAGRTPAEAAKELAGGTRLMDPAFRRSLLEGGEEAVRSSTDPFIQMARRMDPVAREFTTWWEENVESVESAAEEKLAKARFAVYGKTVYPDANFTLRLTYGSVAGYPMNGTVAPAKTTFHGLYDRAAGFDYKDPFAPSPRLMERKDKLNLATPLNFVASLDIIGGNSGSPVVDKDGALVGLIFDGNIESLVGRFVYYQENNRAVAVHAAAMIEALRVLYDAGALAGEIEGKQAAGK